MTKGNARLFVGMLVVAAALVYHAAKPRYDCQWASERMCSARAESHNASEDDRLARCEEIEEEEERSEGSRLRTGKVMLDAMLSRCDDPREVFNLAECIADSTYECLSER